MSLSHGPICGVMVTFNGGDIIATTVPALIDQVDHLIVVDNASDEATATRLRTIQSHYRTKITLIFNSENRGVAAALNQGIGEAFRQNAAFVLLLDQDSTPAPNMVMQMMTACNHAEVGTIGIVSPAQHLISDAEGSVQTIDPAPDGMLVDRLLVWTSGSLIPRSVIESVGLFRDDFFIDHVDHEYCLRLHRAGLRVTVCPAAILNHRLGNLKIGRFLRWSTGYYDYTPTRHYYMVRNGIVLFLESKSLKFLRYYLNWEFKSLLKILVFEANKRRKLSMIALGVRHGLQRKTGRNVSVS